MESLTHTRICIFTLVGFIHICCGAHSSDPLDRKHSDLTEESMFPSVLNLFNAELYVPLNAGFENPNTEHYAPLGESQFEATPMSGQYLPENPFADPYLTCIKIARMVEAYWATLPMPPTDGKLPIGAYATNPYQLDPELVFLGKHYFKWVEQNFTSPIDIYCLQRVILEWQIGETPILHRDEPAKCALTFTVPLEIMPHLWQAWEDSFKTKDINNAGVNVYEHGASIIRTDKSLLVKPEIKKGKSKSIDQNQFAKPKANETHVGSFHTHPYAQFEDFKATYASLPSRDDLGFFVREENKQAHDNNNATTYGFELIFSPPKISAITRITPSDPNEPVLDEEYFLVFHKRIVTLVNKYKKMGFDVASTRRAVLLQISKEYGLCIYENSYATRKDKWPAKGTKWEMVMGKYGFGFIGEFDAPIWRATNKLAGATTDNVILKRKFVIIPPKKAEFTDLDILRKSKINILGLLK